MCWSIVKKKRPNAGSPIFGAFPSDYIPKGKKDAKLYYIFIHPATAGDLLKLLRVVIYIGNKFIFIIVNYIYLSYFMNKLLNFLYPILVVISFPMPTYFPFPVTLFFLPILYRKSVAL